MTNHDHMQFVPATNQTQVPENSGDTAATSQQSNAGENTENGAEITSNIPHMRSGENNSSTRPGDDSPALPEKSASDHTSTSDGIYSGICARQRPRIKRAHPWAPQAGPGLGRTSAPTVPRQQQRCPLPRAPRRASSSLSGLHRRANQAATRHRRPLQRG
jgi:hypothetical protein